MTTVNIIGAGRVGRTFLRLLDTQVNGVASRSFDSAKVAVAEVGHGRAFPLADLPAADIWLLTVPDTQIAKTAEGIPSTVPPALAVHCSGFHAADVMAALRSRGWRLASAHPNLSFADPEEAAASFRGTP